MFARPLLVLALAVCLWAVFARSSDASGPGERYVVQRGDTLWSIASARYRDARAGVFELRRRNGLGGTVIVPGQVIVLP